MAGKEAVVGGRTKALTTTITKMKEELSSTRATFEVEASNAELVLSKYLGTD